jgi:hypothetical protein
MYASKTIPAQAKEIFGNPNFRMPAISALHYKYARPGSDFVTTGRRYLSLTDLPCGAIVAVCKVVNCYQIRSEPYHQVIGAPPVVDASAPGHPMHVSQLHITDQEALFGDYTPDRYAWILADIKALETPIPCSGSQLLWEWDAPAELRFRSVDR